MEEVAKQEQVVPEGSAPGAASNQEPKGQELILGRFKTQDDLAHAYRELETKFTQTAQLKSAAERQAQELATRLNTPPAPKEAEKDYNQMFWENPAEVIRELSGKAAREAAEEVRTESRWETQKDKLRTDPEFANLEPQIDAITAQYPDLKKRPGAMQDLIKMVRGLTYDEERAKREMKERIIAEMNGKVAGSVEAGQPARTPGTETQTTLSDEEKMVARKFNPELGESEAYAKYIERKRKWGV